MEVVFRSLTLAVVQLLILFLGVALLGFMFLSLNASVDLLKHPILAFLSASLYINAIYDIANTYLLNSPKDALNRKTGVLLCCIGLVFASIQIAFLIAEQQVEQFVLSQGFYDVVYWTLVVGVIVSFAAKWIFLQRDGGRVVI